MKENPENFSENILQNIADDLSTINGTCTEIKESQLNCATADDLNNMGTTITSAVTEKVDEMQSSIETQMQTVSDPERVKQIEKEVKDYEDRVQETARALDQKHRLEEKINELNSQAQNSKK